MSANRKAIQNIVLYGLFAALAAWIFILAASFPRPLLPGYPGSAMFPRLAVGLMGLFSVLGLIRELTKLSRSKDSAPRIAAPDDHQDPVEAVSARDVAVVLVILAGFVGVTQWVGMEVGILVFTGLMIYMVTRSAVWAIIAGASSVLVVYFLFVQGLSVFMPLTFLPRYPNW